MKFTDGYWQHLPGVTVLRPREIADVVVGEESLTVYASTVPLTSRGDTLNRPLVTVSFHSPMDDVIGVRIEHHRGGVDRGPSFALTRTAADVKVVEAEDAADGVATFRSGALTARVSTRGAVERRVRGRRQGADLVDRRAPSASSPTPAATPTCTSSSASASASTSTGWASGSARS